MDILVFVKYKKKLIRLIRIYCLKFPQELLINKFMNLFVFDVECLTDSTGSINLKKKEREGNESKSLNQNFTQFLNWALINDLFG